ncbi:hypothetical protein OK18_01140 [Chryseobacterium gallinarum]|uniref:Uncharacterized protein n=1 Tax=Chryseobacterium gallinarum TaxID=1324352 RepID=A0A0G3LWT1_CHRGL|nr:hypothetical protein OK18_01140 [Chryseobacterium gallinarum]
MQTADNILSGTEVDIINNVINWYALKTPLENAGIYLLKRYAEGEGIYSYFCIWYCKFKKNK